MDASISQLMMIVVQIEQAIKDTALTTTIGTNQGNKTRRLVAKIDDKVMKALVPFELD